MTQQPNRRASQRAEDAPASLHIVAQYAAALEARDSERMAALRGIALRAGTSRAVRGR
jgi:hypothetical protein